MPRYELSIGSKYQVFKGIAKETSGGLRKKDIITVKETHNEYINGEKVKVTVLRYKSKKQQNKSKISDSQFGLTKWRTATIVSLDILQNDFGTDSDKKYYKHNVMMKKNVRGRKGKLYNLTKYIYDNLPETENLYKKGKKGKKGKKFNKMIAKIKKQALEEFLK